MFAENVMKHREIAGKKRLLYDKSIMERKYKNNRRRIEKRKKRNSAITNKNV